MLKIGLVINPYAGIGGRVGLKGSDGEHIRDQAFTLGAKKLSMQKALICFKQFEKYHHAINIFTAQGEMGAELCAQLKIPHEIVTNHVELNDAQEQMFTSAEDTENLVTELCKLKVDIIIFVGGDGTARNVFNANSEDQLVLGVPAGVKIHSGVYAVSPEAAGKLVSDLIQGKILSIQQADVVDLDENEFRAGKVKTKYYGEMNVPDSQIYMQAVKNGSQPSEENELIDIAADLVERMEDDAYYVIGSGSTCAAVMEELGIDNTLLGSDIIKNNQLYIADAVESDLLELLSSDNKVIFILTVIGGQGHLLGRGNHQISPQVIKAAGWSSFEIIATKNKLAKLEGKPLQVDTGELELDHKLFGLKKVTTGYHEQVLYTVGFTE
ncbi:MAG: ATP-NAD kinase family protein [Kangiellaceae bacterium]